MKKNHLIFTLFGIAALTLLVASVIRITSVEAQEIGNGLIFNPDTSIDSEATILAAKFVRQIDIISKVKINTGLFESDTFKSLRDWSRPIPTEESGRANPFAPY